MLGFCEKCRNRVEYSIKEESKVKTIKGKIIKRIRKDENVSVNVSECQ